MRDQNVHDEALLEDAESEDLELEDDGSDEGAELLNEVELIPVRPAAEPMAEVGAAAEGRDVDDGDLLDDAEAPAVGAWASGPDAPHTPSGKGTAAAAVPDEATTAVAVLDTPEPAPEPAPTHEEDETPAAAAPEVLPADASREAPAAEQVPEPPIPPRRRRTPAAPPLAGRGEEHAELPGRRGFDSSRRE